MIINRVRRICQERAIEPYYESQGGRCVLPTLGRNEIFRFLSAGVSSSSSSISPLAHCVIELRDTPRVVISNSLLRPHASC